MSVAATVVSVIAVMMSLLWFVLEWRAIADRAPYAGKHSLVGLEALSGKKAKVVREFVETPTSDGLLGAVRVNGETWRAELDSGTDTRPQPGEQVIIVRADGLLLKVAAEGAKST